MFDRAKVFEVEGAKFELELSFDSFDEDVNEASKRTHSVVEGSGVLEDLVDGAE